MVSKETIRLVTFQEKSVMVDLKASGVSKVPLDFKPTKGRGIMSDCDFEFAYNWIRTQMKSRIRSYEHQNFPYWCCHVPGNLTTKSRMEDLKEIFCDRGRKILVLDVPIGQCLFTSFDLFDGHVLRKRFIGTEEETSSFYGRISLEVTNCENLSPGLIKYEDMPTSSKVELVESLGRSILDLYKDDFNLIIKSGDFIQVTIPEIRAEYLVSQ